MPLLFEKQIGKKLKIGMVFPGQGSQFLGMGKDFYDTERLVQELFEDASSALKENFVKLCYSSSEKTLEGPIAAQTGIFLVSASIYTVLNNIYGITPDLIVGHSIGEFSAVFAAGGLNFFDSLYLLNKRALIMEKVVQSQQGGLLEVTSLNQNILEMICSRYDHFEGTNHVAELAIFNSPTQVTVSGTLEELKLIAEDVVSMKGKASLLPVSGAYHSRMLKDAQQELSMFLVKVDFHDLKIPIINNVFAKEVKTATDVKLTLVAQIASHLHWWDAVQGLKDMDLIIEVGPGEKLKKIFTKEWPDKPVVSINNYQDISLLLDQIQLIEESK